MQKLDEWLAKDRTGGSQGILMWIAEQKLLFPELKNEYEVPKIPMDDHIRRNPIEELESMVGPEKVVVVELGDNS